jgi:hypothetical protein
VMMSGDFVKMVMMSRQNLKYTETVVSGPLMTDMQARRNVCHQFHLHLAGRI